MNELRFLTKRELVGMVGLSKSTIRRRVIKGTFPRPRDIGEGQIRWRSDEVQEWMAAQPPANAQLTIGMELHEPA